MSETTPETTVEPQVDEAAELPADDTDEAYAEAGFTDERDGTPAGQSIVEESTTSREAIGDAE